MANENLQQSQVPSWSSEFDGPTRVDSIIAAIPPPVTRAAVAALLEKARLSAFMGPAKDRHLWDEIAEELARRVDDYEA